MSNIGQVLVPTNNLSFTNLNFISGTQTATASTSRVLYIPPTSAFNTVGQYLAAPSTPYCLICNVCSNMGNYNAYTNPQIFGIGFYDGTKLVTVMAQWSSTITMGLNVYYQSSVTATPSSLYGATEASGQPTGTLQWFQIRDDGTNIYFYVGYDAAALDDTTHWVQVYSEARTTHLSAPTDLFWGGINQGSSGPAIYLTLNSWQTVAL